MIGATNAARRIETVGQRLAASECIHALAIGAARTQVLPEQWQRASQFVVR